MKRTNHSQDMDQIAGIIAGMCFPWVIPMEKVQEINDKWGFTFDVRYDTAEYIGDSWHRREGVVLSDDDLETCYNAAIAAMERGDYSLWLSL